MNHARAEKANRADKIGFMSGSVMGRQISNSSEFLRAVESAKDDGDSYYLVSLPRDETGLETIRIFARGYYALIQVTCESTSE